jgi:hypothetical protein
VPLPRASRIAHERLISELRARLGEPELAEAMQCGQHMTVEEVSAGAPSATNDEPPATTSSRDVGRLRTR